MLTLGTRIFCGVCVVFAAAAAPPPATLPPGPNTLEVSPRELVYYSWPGMRECDLVRQGQLAITSKTPMAWHALVLSGAEYLRLPVIAQGISPGTLLFDLIWPEMPGSYTSTIVVMAGTATSIPVFVNVRLTVLSGAPLHFAKPGDVSGLGQGSGL